MFSCVTGFTDILQCDSTDTRHFSRSVSHLLLDQFPQGWRVSRNNNIDCEFIVFCFFSWSTGVPWSFPWLSVEKGKFNVKKNTAIFSRLWYIPILNRTNTFGGFLVKCECLLCEQIKYRCAPNRWCKNCVIERGVDEVVCLTCSFKTWVARQCWDRPPLHTWPVTSPGQSSSPWSELLNQL